MTTASDPMPHRPAAPARPTTGRPRPTRRDNLLRCLRGERPDWVPLTLNLWQWWETRRRAGTLPAEIAHLPGHLEVSRWLGCDLFSRNLDGGWRQGLSAGPATVDTQRQPTAHGDRVTTRIRTPHGTLETTTQQIDAIASWHTETYPVKDWDRDRAAWRAWWDQTTFAWDEAAALRSIATVGDDGVAMLPLAYTPLKFLHHQFGLDGACYFAADHPADAAALCAEFWARVRPHLVRAAAHPQVAAMILMDNVDTPFYPPRLAARFWAPAVADAAAIFGAHGKAVFVHACGKLKGLGRIFADTRVTGLEGIAHPPIGDWSLAEATACHPGFIANGGWSAHEQGLDAAALASHVPTMLARTPKERVIIAASCNTAPETPWERIRQYVDLVRAWGGSPGGA